jgi:OOP family OmpA-OmpF porin
MILRGVNFDFDKSNIRADARPVLDEAINILNTESGISVVAEGHTDSVGTDAYNKRLSERRARAVKDYLVKGGISSSRIETVGYGESQPVASNDTADGRAQNRRVELKVKGQ